MKKIILSLVIFVAIFVLAGQALKTNAQAAPVLEEGAQIRTDEYAGMRFTAKATAVDGATYGFVLAKGQVANLEIGAEGALNYETAGLKEDGTYCLTITSFPEEAYAQDVTARAYVLVNGVATYSETQVTRNLAEVASGAANKNQSGEFGAAVKSYISSKYMKT